MVGREGEAAGEEASEVEGEATLLLRDKMHSSVKVESAMIASLVVRSGNGNDGKQFPAPAE